MTVPCAPAAAQTVDDAQETPYRSSPTPESRAVADHPERPRLRASTVPLAPTATQVVGTGHEIPVRNLVVDEGTGVAAHVPPELVNDSTVPDAPTARHAPASGQATPARPALTNGVAAHVVPPSVLVRTAP